MALYPKQLSSSLAVRVKAHCQQDVELKGKGRGSNGASIRSVECSAKKTEHVEGRAASGDAVIQGTATEFCGDRGCILFTPMHDEKIGTNFC